MFLFFFGMTWNDQEFLFDRLLFLNNLEVFWAVRRSFFAQVPLMIPWHWSRKWIASSVILGPARLGPRRWLFVIFSIATWPSALVAWRGSSVPPSWSSCPAGSPRWLCSHPTSWWARWWVFRPCLGGDQHGSTVFKEFATRCWKLADWTCWVGVSVLYVGICMYLKDPNM